MKKNHYRLRLGAIFLTEFVLGWIALALYFGITRDVPAWLLTASPLIPPYFVVIGWRVIFTGLPKTGFFLNLLVVFSLLVSVVLPFMKRKWAKVAYLAGGMIVIYWVFCGLLVEAVLRR